MATGADRISGLPDELLHAILIRLPSTVQAARTSALSRRWRAVWAHAPALSFTNGPDQPRGASIYDAIDAALDAYAAPSLGRLTISIDDVFSCHDRGARVPRWLRFAAEHLAGELRIHFGHTLARYKPPDRHRSLPHTSPPLKEAELPVCERATAIDLSLRFISVQIRIPAAGTFVALRVLRISHVNLPASDLERAVSSQCPRLQELALSDLVVVCAHGLSIRSDSLERLKLGTAIRAPQATVQAPKLIRLETSVSPQDMHRVRIIAARNLGEVIWHRTYDKQLHEIVEAGRHLRRLEVMYMYQVMIPVVTMAPLFQLFDTVDELVLNITISGRRFQYKDFWMDTAELPRCKVLKIRLITCGSHAFEAILLHLLRKCSSARKLDIHWISYGKAPDYPRSGTDGCSCCGELGTDSIAAEEVELSFTKMGVREEGIVQLLLRSCGEALRKLAIHRWRGSPTLSTAACERIASFCPPETSVQFFGC